MARFTDNTAITTIAGNDILPIVDISEPDDDKKISVDQIATYAFTNVQSLSGKVLSDNNLTNTLKTGYDDAVTKAHKHTNSTAVGKVLDNGDGASYLANDGTYKVIDVPNSVNPNIVVLGNQSTSFTLTANRIHTANIASSCTLLLPTISTTTKYVNCMIEFSLASGQSLTLPTVKWDWGYVPTFSTTVKNVISFRTTDNGNTWRASYKQEGA